MAEILILESEERYRVLLRFILEGINHRIVEAIDRDHLPEWPEGRGPDLIIIGVHLELEGDDTMGDWPIWQHGLPDAPVLVLFSGNPHLKPIFLKHWSGTTAIKCLDQPVDPYPLLAMVKALLTAPAEWRKGGQHAL
jgi:DNA-binding response OmpR family regulator